MVSIQDVRDVLTNLSSDRVPDATVEKQIEIANTTIDNERAKNIPEATAEDAKLVMAAYLTLAAYATKIERSAGGTPPAIARQLDFWERMKDQFLEYIRRGSVTLQPLVAQPETLREQWLDGELADEVY